MGNRRDVLGLGLFVILLSTLGVNSAFTITTAEDFVTYENEIKGIKIQYPSHWERDLSNPIALSVSAPLENLNDRFQETLFVSAGTLPYSMSTEEYVENVLKALELIVPNLTILETENYILSGYPAKKVVFSTDYGDLKTKSIWVGTTLNDRAYGVLFRSEQDKFLDNLPLSEKIFESFEITQPSYNIPDWIRNNAEWWAQGAIGDNDFVSGIQFLIKEGILQIPETAQGATADDSAEIPAWIKNNAGWWAEGAITDDDFVKGLQYLIENGIMTV